MAVATAIISKENPAVLLLVIFCSAFTNSILSHTGEHLYVTLCINFYLLLLLLLLYYYYYYYYFIIIIILLFFYTGKKFKKERKLFNKTILYNINVRRTDNDIGCVPIVSNRHLPVLTN